MIWRCYDDVDDADDVTDDDNDAASAADDDNDAVKAVEPRGGGRVHQLFELQANAPWKYCIKVPCYHIVSQISISHHISASLSREKSSLNQILYVGAFSLLR